MKYTIHVLKKEIRKWFVAGFLVCTGTSFAVETTFTNVSDTDWWTSANWDKGIPTAADDVWIGSDGSSAVTLDLLSGEGKASRIQAAAQNGDTHVLTVENSTLTVDGGSDAQNNVFKNTHLQIKSGGNVNFLATGRTSTEVNIALENATIDIAQGASLTVGSSGTKVALRAGFPRNTGTINVNGGTLNVYHALYLGTGGNAEGNLNISGSTADVKTGSLVIGDYGGSGMTSKVSMSDGTLDIAALGYPAASLDPLYVGSYANGLFELSGGTVKNNQGKSNIGSRSTDDGITGIVDHTGGTWQQGASELNIGTSNSKNVTGKYLLSGTGVLEATNNSHNVAINVGGTETTNTAYLVKNGGTLIVDNLNIYATGYLLSGADEEWQIYGNFNNQSEKNTAFNMEGATLRFQGERAHTINVAGSDFGAAMTLNQFTGSIDNFALDAIALDSASDTLTLTNTLEGSRALYINTLFLPDDDTSLIGSNITSVAGLNIYYRSDDPRSAYLNGLTYDLNGGGQLIAIPESTPFGLLMCALACGYYYWKRRAKGSRREL